jgi:hypothetical protein
MPRAPMRAGEQSVPAAAIARLGGVLQGMTEIDQRASRGTLFWDIRLSNQEQRMGSSSLVQQTPGDPSEPNSGEPTIMAFRRPADRPASGGNAKAPAHSQSFGAADALPVVLRLPDLARGPSAAPPVAPVGSKRPWIGIAMWCATGALAVVAVVLIFTGKPESPPPADEAPQWRTGSAATGGADHSPRAGDAGGAMRSDRPVEANAGSPAVDATHRQAADGSSATQPPATAHLPSDATPTGGRPPSFAPGNTFPGGPNPGNAAPGSSVPADGQRRPTGDSSAPTGLSDPWPPEGPATDQSKLQTEVRSAVRPNTARFDGGIRHPELRPSNDISR